MPSGVVEDESRRCTFTRMKDGKRQRCKRAASVGLDVCDSHGGQLPQPQRKSRTAKAVGALHALITPVPAGDWEANPGNALLMDVRRTIAGIRYYDEKIAQLEDERDLIWGLSSEERVDGYEKGDLIHKTTRQYTSEMNGFVKLRLEERKHLLNLTKVWISAKLDEKRIEIEEQTVFALNTVIVNILRAVGKDVNDPDIRRVVRDQLLALPAAGAKVIDG